MNFLQVAKINWEKWAQLYVYFETVSRSLKLNAEFARINY